MKNVKLLKRYKNFFHYHFIYIHICIQIIIMFIFFQEVCAEPEVICNDEEKCETVDEEVLVYKIPF